MKHFELLRSQLRMQRLSIPSAGRQPMKPSNVIGVLGSVVPFNTLCGSSANEASAQQKPRGHHQPFNTLCGSSANEANQPAAAAAFAAAPFNTLCGSSANEAYRTRSKCAEPVNSFNTLCGSSANEAHFVPASWLCRACLSIPSAGRQPMKRTGWLGTARRGWHFQYPLRVVSQ